MTKFRLGCHSQVTSFYAADDDPDFNVSSTTTEKFKEISNADDVKDKETTARLDIKAEDVRMKLLKHECMEKCDDDGQGRKDRATPTSSTCPPSTCTLPPTR